MLGVWQTKFGLQSRGGMMERVCANCGMPIYENEKRLRCRDNYLISKYFDSEENNIFCSEDCFCEALSVKEYLDEDEMKGDGWHE